MKAKKDLSVHYSSEKQDWETPKSLFDELSEMYGPFDLDVCASKDNKKCTFWFGIDKNIDGLTRDWTLVDAILEDGSQRVIGRRCWMNPVYNDLATWLKKAYDESQLGCTVVCLIPSRTDTAAWHQYVMKAAEILLIRGRVKFVGAAASAPFPSCVVVFRQGDNTPVFKSFTPRKK